TLFSKSFTRRWQASFGGADLAAWALVGAVIVTAGVYAWLVGTGRAGPGVPARSRHRPTVAAGAGIAWLGSAGLVATDSSFAVRATMLIVGGPVLVLRSSGAVPAPPVPEDLAPAPDGPPTNVALGGAR